MYTGTTIFGIEICVRFISCPNKRRFWKSINAVDMMVSLLEVSCYVYSRVTLYVFIPHAYEIDNSDILCTATKYVDMGIIVIGQMRYMRLLSYASVYRYVNAVKYIVSLSV